MKTHHYLILAAMLACIVSPSYGQEKADKEYSNPVVSSSLPDPTILEDNGVFYLYSTESIRNVPIMCSPDLVNWKYCGTVFTNETRPTFVEGGGIWAPDINMIAPGKYALYYSMSVWGGEDSCGIGVAIADNPLGPWENKGKMFISSEIGVTNSIDPFYIEEDGIKYLIWGSFRGIYGIELTEDGLSVNPDAVPVKIAGGAYEGTYIHKRGGYYYMFASVGSCCAGFNSTYKTVVGRSEHLFGPYVNKAGERMLENHHEVVISGNDTFIGTGHNSEIVTDKAGNDWILYHAYCREVGNKSRTLMLDKVIWNEDGWPSVNDGTPASIAIKPVF